MKTWNRTCAFATLVATFLAASNPTAGQSDCSELTVDHLWYAAFTDTALEVGMLHSGGSSFGYPSFTVVDAGNDTLTQNFGGLFILPTGNSLHSLALHDGVPLPPSPFIGQVLLNYAAFPGDSTCVFTVNATDLCPSTCVNAWIDVYQPGSPVNTNLSWTVRDTAGSIVVFGDMQLNDTDHTQEIDSMCLAPGHYTIEIEQSPFETPASFACSVFRDLFYIGGPSFPFTGFGTLAFDWFPACFDSGTGIEELISPSLLWSISAGQLLVATADGSALGSLVIHDARGTAVHTSSTRSDRVIIDLSACAPGVYLITRRDKSHHSSQRFILH